MKKYTNYHAFTREMYKFSKNYCKIYEKSAQKVKMFHNMTFENLKLNQKISQRFINIHEET